MKQLQTIQRKIFSIRGKMVMLDSDLAELYDVSTKALKQAVKRNIDRFPQDFMFELTRKEFQNLRSQFVTSSHGGSRYFPYAFTEQGVAMLSSILKSQRAIQINIIIMRAFVQVKSFLLGSKEIKKQLKEVKKKLGKHDSQISEILLTIEGLLVEKTEKIKWNSRKRIGYN